MGSLGRGKRFTLRRTNGIKAGDYAVVQGADFENHRLRVATRDGRAAEYDARV